MKPPGGLPRRFSLRTLFVMMAIFGIALVYIVDACRVRVFDASSAARAKRSLERINQRLDAELQAELVKSMKILGMPVVDPGDEYSDEQLKVLQKIDGWSAQKILNQADAKAWAATKARYFEQMEEARRPQLPPGS